MVNSMETTNSAALLLLLFIQTPALSAEYAKRPWSLPAACAPVPARPLPRPAPALAGRGFWSQHGTTDTPPAPWDGQSQLANKENAS